MVLLQLHFHHLVGLSRVSERKRCVHSSHYNEHTTSERSGCVFSERERSSECSFFSEGCTAVLVVFFASSKSTMVAVVLSTNK